MNPKEMQGNILFNGMDITEIGTALSCLSATEKRYEKGEHIYLAGQVIGSMGLVLDGSVTIESNDMWGNKTILSHVGSGQFFAEVYALLDQEPMLVDVTANENCQILFLQIGSLKKIASIGKSWSAKLIANLLTISARKNLALSGRSLHTAPKTIRERVMSYLNSLSLQHKSDEFDIPFDRQQMADYLNLDRTALSKELGRMKRDGIISVKKNHFKILGVYTR